MSRPIDQVKTSRPNTPRSAKSFGLEAVLPILQMHDSFLDCLIDRLSSADHTLCANALSLINALIRDSIINSAENEWPQLVTKLQTLGVANAVENLMRGGALIDLAAPLLEYQGLTKVMLARWRSVRVENHIAEHRAALRQLHVSSFRPDLTKSPFSLDDRSQPNGTDEDRAPDKWRRLGFQTEKPARAFEDAGYLGLRDLSEYVRRNLETFQNTLLEQSVIPIEQRCPFARASLSVTMLLYEYFNVESIRSETLGSTLPTDVEANDFERHIEPLLIRWDRLHCASLGAFLKLWKEAGAVAKDYHKIEDLTRLLIGNVLGRSDRKVTAEQVEQDLLSAPLRDVRAWQLLELEEAYSYAWGADYEYVPHALSLLDMLTICPGNYASWSTTTHYSFSRSNGYAVYSKGPGFLSFQPCLIRTGSRNRLLTSHRLQSLRGDLCGCHTTVLSCTTLHDRSVQTGSCPSTSCRRG